MKFFISDPRPNEGTLITQNGLVDPACPHARAFPIPNPALAFPVGTIFWSRQLCVRTRSAKPHSRLVTTVNWRSDRRLRQIARARFALEFLRDAPHRRCRSFRNGRLSRKMPNGLL